LIFSETQRLGLSLQERQLARQPFVYYWATFSTVRRPPQIRLPRREFSGGEERQHEQFLFYNRITWRVYNRHYATSIALST